MQEINSLVDAPVTLSETDTFGLLRLKSVNIHRLHSSRFFKIERITNDNFDECMLRLCYIVCVCLISG